MGNATSATLLAGIHPKHGRLFAAFDPQTRFTESAVAASRLSAYLHPYKDATAARAALIAAGAELEGSGR